MLAHPALGTVAHAIPSPNLLGAAGSFPTLGREETRAPYFTTDEDWTPYDAGPRAPP